MEGSFGVRKGAWTTEEDILLRQWIDKHGEGKWHQVPLRAGLNRCRKSCRLRWLNYLKPNIKRGIFEADEVDLMIRLHKLLGNRWSLIAGRLPGRTANDVKNYWNSHLHKKVISRITDVKEKAQDRVRVNVIKPRPRTFSKNLTWLSRKPTIKESFQPKVDDVTNLSPTLMPFKWWECLLDDKEGDDRATFTVSGLDEDQLNTTNLWADEIAPEAKVGDTFDENGLNWLDDLSLDMGLWDLLHAE